MYRLVVAVLVFGGCSTDYTGQISLQLDAEALNPAVRRAIDRWERETGLDLFVEAPGGVRVSLGCPKPGFGGWTDVDYDYRAGSMTGNIWLCAEGLASFPDLVDEAVTHELGHTLRLEHFEEAGNVMSTTLAREWHISEDQVARVRETTHDVAEL